MTRKHTVKANTFASLAMATCLAFAPALAFANTIPDDPNLDFVIDDTTNLTLTGGVTTNASPSITVDSTAGLTAGDAITGTGIPNGATILSVDSGTEITISANASADNVGLNLTTSAPHVPANVGTTDVKTIAVTDTSHRIIDIGAGNILRLGDAGSITRDLAGDQRNRLTINGGSLTAGGADNIDGNLHFRAHTATNDNNSRNASTIFVNADIVDNGTGIVSVSKNGRQIVVLAGNNTYSGDTVVTQGFLRSTVAGNLGTGDVYAVGNTATDSPGLSLNGVGQYTNDFFIAGEGTQVVRNGGGWGALWIGPGAEVTGTVTLLANSRITSMSYSSASATPAVVSGQITGNFRLELGSSVNDTQGTMMISNPANDWTGGTLINSSGTSGGAGVRVILGASEVIPNGANAGNLTIRINSTNPTATLDLNGFSETINGLLSTGIATGKREIRSNVAGDVMFTLGDNNADGNFFGQIMNGSGVLSLTKIGTGTQILRGTNTYSGATTITAGTLALGSVDSSGSINNSASVALNAGAVLDTTNIAFTMLGAQPFTFTLDPTGAGSAGLLNAGDLDISAGAVVFDTLAPLDDLAYIIASYTSLTGSAFDAITNLPAGYELVYNYQGNNIALVIPEPASMTLLAIGGLMLLKHRRWA